MEILEDLPGKQILLLGNEAITRGALEAGINIATTYPGTPSSEIADTFQKLENTILKIMKSLLFILNIQLTKKLP